ncbi:MAG: hypothetical protein FWB73_00965 [Treponema sp.]|nr:hypothetical protein [Treponema sp.]
MNKFLKLSLLIIFISAVFLSLASCDFINDLLNNDTNKDTTLSGTVTLTGETRPGKSLTATASLNAKSGFSYQWKRTNASGESTNISGVTGRIYSIRTTDVNSDISVTVTCTGYTGSVESNALIIRAGEDLSGTYHDFDDILPSLIFTDFTVIKIYDSNDPEHVIVDSEGTYVANDGILTLNLKSKLDNSDSIEIYDYQLIGKSLELFKGNDAWIFVKDDRAENAIIIDLEAMNEWDLLAQQSREVNRNANLSFTVIGNYSGYKWYVNGVLVSSTGSSYVFNQSTAGIYELVVVVTNSQNQSRSQRCWITVK